MLITMKIILGSLILFSSVYADTIEIFDGKSLDGWHGDAKFWKVTDGFITGESTEANPCNKTTYLTYTKKEFSNFEFEVSFRFLSKEGNSGIQYRSSWANKDLFTVKGYQADVEVGQKYSGILYEQDGRKILAKRGEEVLINLSGKKAVSKTFLKEGRQAQESIKHGEWNTYRVVADGNTLTHQINGFTTISVVDEQVEKSALKGLLALQLHAGPAMKIQFKDVKILELNKTSTEASAPQWIGSNLANTNQQLVFSKEFNLEEIPNKVDLNYSADAIAKLFINGKRVINSNRWKDAKHIDVSSFLKVGLNEISVKTSNEKGRCALCLKLGDILSSDESWVILEQGKKALVNVIAAHGEKPWGKILTEEESHSIQTLPNFKVTKLHDVVKKTQGSWVSMCFAPNGDLYVADQYGSIFKVILNNGEVASISPVASPGNAQGMCWAFGSLYVTSHLGSKSGMYRLTDTNNDGKFNKREKVLSLIGKGEHGPHNIILSEDGKSLYVVVGNKTPLPAEATSILNHNWKEDTLLKHLPDANGHASGLRAPGGALLKVSPDGKTTEVISSGLRNTYDIAINPQGEIFGFDSDMEWDVGTSWYRPTRILHLVKGAEFGWRTGTSKWPDYYADSLGSVVDVGPGSPTGILFGTDTNFPSKYKKALFALDWTFGRIYAVHLREDGSSYKGELEVFLSGKPLPLADAQVGPDGSIYFLTGGRRLQSALYRVDYTGELENTKLTTKPSEASITRNNLLDKPSIEHSWALLDSDDRTLSYTARVGLEQFPVEDWQLKFSSEQSPEKVIMASLAFARLNGDPSLLFDKLTAIDYAKLSEQSRLHYLRAVALGFIRSEEIDEAYKTVLRSQLIPFYQVDGVTGKTEKIELCKILTYLKAKEALIKGAAMMESSVTQAHQVDKSLLEGNSEYGDSINEMLNNQPDTYALSLALVLMNAKSGWNVQSATQYFTWLNKAESKSGGKSYIGFIKNIRKQALLNAGPKYRRLVNKLPKYEAPKEEAPLAKGPGRAWTLEEATALLGDLSNANRANGERMYKASLCYTCHSYSGKGGNSGPDLSNLAGRFEKKDIIKAILDPSEVISDQYAFSEFTLKDGTKITGKIMKQEAGRTHIAISAFDLEAAQMTVNTTDIVSSEYSKTSPMPASLINNLNSDELRDLVKYLTEK